MVPRRVVAALIGAALLFGSACSDDSSNPSTTSVAATTAADPGALPVVEQIRPAIAALEEQLGGPQRYFEINATTKLVNIFLALNNGAVSQAWVYFDGELSSQEGQPASGHTFPAAALTFDAANLLKQVRADLASTRLEFVEILGGQGDAVQYTVGARSAEGGGLVITVAPDGKVLTVGAA